MHTLLNKIQTELKANKGQHNSFGGYDYRSCEDILEAVKPFLKESGATLVLSDDVIEVLDRVYVKATVTLTLKDTSVSATACAREEFERKKFDASQLTGTASSYARKYALSGLFCLDDTKDADTQESEDLTHRFKPGEKDKIIAQSLECLEMQDKLGLAEILNEYGDDPEVKTKVWYLFNSEQRANMKKLLSGE